MTTGAPRSESVNTASKNSLDSQRLLDRAVATRSAANLVATQGSRWNQSRLRSPVIIARASAAPMNQSLRLRSTRSNPTGGSDVSVNLGQLVSRVSGEERASRRVGDERQRRLVHRHRDDQRLARVLVIGYLDDPLGRSEGNGRNGDPGGRGRGGRFFDAASTVGVPSDSRTTTAAGSPSAVGSASRPPLRARRAKRRWPRRWRCSGPAARP